jgi:hypothetical protein
MSSLMRTPNSALLLLGLMTAGTVACVAAPDLSKLPPPSDRKGVTYEKDIRPILENSCFRCHGDQRPRGGLRLNSLEALLKGSEDGPVVKPGSSKDSPLVIAVAQIDEDTAMPPKRRPGGPGGPGGRGGFGPGMILSRQMVSQGDKDQDGKLSQPEISALADDWFDKLDPQKTGKLTQEEFTARLGDVLPPPQGGARREGGAPPGGGRGFGPGRFIGPGLFAAADSNKDGSLTRDELKNTFVKWFTDWDTAKTGKLEQEKIQEGLNSALPRPNFGGPRGPGGPGGPGGPERAGGGPGGPGGGAPGNFGPPPPPLTAEQVGLVRAWIDQGAK